MCLENIRDKRTGTGGSQSYMRITQAAALTGVILYYSERFTL